jgi:hypothetical protein
VSWIRRIFRAASLPKTLSISSIGIAVEKSFSGSASQGTRYLATPPSALASGSVVP